MELNKTNQSKLCTTDIDVSKSDKDATMRAATARRFARRASRDEDAKCSISGSSSSTQLRFGSDIFRITYGMFALWCPGICMLHFVSGILGLAFAVLAVISLFQCSQLTTCICLLILALCPFLMGIASVRINETLREHQRMELDMLVDRAIHEEPNDQDA